METKKYLDKQGLTYFWTKAKKYIDDSRYILPIATATELGGVKIGNNLKIDSDGVLNIDISSTHSPTGTTVVNGIAVEDALSTSGINIKDDGKENILIESIKGQTNVIIGE